MPKPVPARNTESRNGYILGYWGSETFGRLFVEAARGLDEEAATLGFTGLTSAEAASRMSALPQKHEAVDRGPTMVFGAAALPFLFKVMAFVQEPVTKALVQVVSGEFFKLVIPKLGGIFTRKKPTEAIEYPISFRPAMFFEAENVLVTAIMTIRKPDDYKAAETLVPLAFERAVDWLERNGPHRSLPHLPHRQRQAEQLPVGLRNTARVTESPRRASL